MRPDKKKKQHHDSRKRAEKSRENVPGRSEPEPESNPQQEETEDNKVSARNEEPSKEVKSKVKDAKVIEEKPLKNISSNWTKYELPSEDEDEEAGTMTGLNFNFALENAVGSSAQFRLKSEREWEERQNVFTTEFFSLDIRVLETAIASIPLQTQLQMDEKEFDASTFARLQEKTERNKLIFSDSILKPVKKTEESLNEKLLNILTEKDSSKDEKSDQSDSDLDDDIDKLLQDVGTVSLGKSDSSSVAPSHAPAATNTKQLEDWLDDFLSD